MIRLYHQIIYYHLGRTYYKMTITEKTKIIDNKIEQNKDQYDLGRQTTKISALPLQNVSQCEVFNWQRCFTRI